MKIYSSFTPHLMFHLNVKRCYQPEALPWAICHFDKMQSYRSFKAPAESKFLEIGLNCFESVSGTVYISTAIHIFFEEEEEEGLNFLTCFGEDLV